MSFVVTVKVFSLCFSTVSVSEVQAHTAAEMPNDILQTFFVCCMVKEEIKHDSCLGVLSDF